MRKSVLAVTALGLSLTSAQALDFQNACKPGSKITIGAVGDIMFHSATQRNVYANKRKFDSLWPDVRGLMQRVGVMYGNLESPAAPGVAIGGRLRKDPGLRYDGNVYSGFPLFNVHPSVLKSLKSAGVDIISFANNHSMDRGVNGVNRTLSQAKKVGLITTGARVNPGDPQHAITNHGGWRIGWVGCTFSTNGVPDPKKQIRLCYNGSVTEAIKALKPKVDAVIVAPHWGVEYSSSVSSRQRSFAKKWLNAGAVAILGAHPHVPQKWEVIKTADGRDGFVIYSMGNFISTQGGINKRSAPFVVLGLTKADGKAWVNGVRYVPLYMLKRPRKVVPATGAYRSAATYLKQFYGAKNAMAIGASIETNQGC